MVLDGEDDGEGRRHERRLGDRLHDVPERDLGRQRVAVVDDGLAVVAVPAVQLDASATGQQDLKAIKGCLKHHGNM